MSNDITTDDVKHAFSLKFWLDNGRTTQATTESFLLFDAWLEEVKENARQNGYDDGYQEGAEDFS